MMNISDYPTNVWIELTNVCNLSCPLCPHSSMKREQGMMDFNRYKRIIDEIAGNVRELTLHHFGESTLHPDFIEMASYAYSSGICPIILSTNGTTLGKITDDILNTGIDILTISIDGATKATYEKLRKGSRFDEISGNVRKLLERKRVRGLTSPSIILQIVDNPETHGEIDEFIGMWKGLLNIHDCIAVKNFNDFAGTIGSPDKSRALIPMPCRILFENLVILWNGESTPCCIDMEGEMRTGNVFAGSIRKVWHSREFSSIRAAAAEGVRPQPCMTCTLGVGQGVYTEIHI
jgi:radical SAM protein with 4Fe4S-binding SPASM domain